MEYRKSKRHWQHYLSMPIIYGMIVPIVLLDLSFEIYHRLCFPLYGLPIVKRSEFIRVDRHKLTYLIVGERFNCMYCGYVNGLIMYIQRIVGDTERYWCGIKHDGKYIAPPHHKDFVEYGDEKEYKKKYF